MNNIDIDLFKLLKLDIPVQEEPELGFLEIIKKSHHENIISSIYEYFLNRKNDIFYSNLFISSLLELIDLKKNIDIQLKDFEVKTEITTQKRNRIDLAIYDDENKNAIIIENKIYHHFDNDLDDYWNHFENYNQKIGILLTLNPFEIPKEFKDRFINITHLEWIERIKQNKMQFKPWNKTQVYLLDFFQTIDNLSTNYKMNDLTKFYFQNAQIVQNAIKSQKDGRSFIEEQQNILATLLGLDLFEKSGDRMDFVNYWEEKNNNQTFYTVIFENLFNGKFEISIIIELIQKDKAIQNILTNRLKDDKDFNSFDSKPFNAENYTHFLKKDYNLSLSDLENLAKFIYEKIEKDFSVIMAKIQSLKTEIHSENETI